MDDGFNRDIHKNVIIYGIGECYHSFRDRIINDIRPDFVCDIKLNGLEEYDGIKTVSMEDISSLDTPLVILALENKSIISMLTGKLDELGISHTLLSDLYGKDRCVLSGEEILARSSVGVYLDSNNNRIVLGKFFSPNICVEFFGNNNTVVIKDNVVVINALRIACASSSYVEIGNDCEITKASLICSNSRIVIGNDCLLSSGIHIMGQDGHHIFDRATGKRLNYSKDIILGNQVWVGEDVLLLGGANIGDGSILGAKCVTSSEFKDHVIVAGVPGKVIRENIIWSKDSNFYFNHDYFDECIDQRATKYLSNDDVNSCNYTR